MRYLGLVLVIWAACTPIPPVTPPVDASDAAVPTYDGAFSPSPCGKACAAMQAVGCVVQADCETVLTVQTKARTIRNAMTGNALTCDDIAIVTTAGQILAIGQPCGPSAGAH